MGTKILESIKGQQYIPVVTEVERAFDGIGLMRGAWAPVKRFVFGAATTYIIEEAFKPSFAYDAGGNKRPWLYTQGASNSSTIFPFWAPPLLAGIALSVFI